MSEAAESVLELATLLDPHALAPPQCVEGRCSHGIAGLEIGGDLPFVCELSGCSAAQNTENPKVPNGRFHFEFLLAPRRTS